MRIVGSLKDDYFKSFFAGLVGFVGLGPLPGFFSRGGWLGLGFDMNWLPLTVKWIDARMVRSAL